MSDQNMSDEQRQQIADELLAEYLHRTEAGEVIDRDEFLRLHPEVAEPLRAYFAGADSMQRLIPQAGSGLPAEGLGTVPYPDSARRGDETIAPRGLTDSAGMPAGPFTTLPRQFGRYRVEKLLGTGAMGAVYLAHDTQLARPVALKVPRLSGHEDSDIVNRLLREAKAAANLNHPNICRVYDAGVEAGTFYIAMEYIDGRLLSDFISPDHLQDERRSVNVVRKLAAALAEAHGKGIIHRDLKPANIIVNARGEPILTDFGLARLTDQPRDGRATQSGMLIGSPAYMSPEQANGDTAKIGPRSDIYSLGVLLFELLTSRLPFQGSVLTILSQITGKEPPAPSSLRPGLDPRLDFICQRLMAKQPEDRYASMTEVGQELQNWLKAAPLIVPPETGAATTGAAPATGGLKAAKEEAATAKKGDLATPAEVTQQERRAQKLMDEQNYDAAIPLLVKLSELEGTLFKDTAAWAKTTLSAAKQKQQKLRERIAATFAKARTLMGTYNYGEVAQMLDAIPAAARTDEVRQLLSTAGERFEDCLSLQDEIDTAVRAKNYERLLPLVKRFLKLKPDNTKMQRLAKDLARNRPERAVRNFKGTGKYFDVAGRLVEPKEIVGGLCFIVALVVGVSYGVKFLQKLPAAGDLLPSPNIAADQPEERDGAKRPLQDKAKQQAGGRVRDLFDATRQRTNEEARSAQQQAAKDLECQVVERNSIGMELVLIPPGRFKMGSPPSENDRGGDEDQVQVTLLHPFWLGRTEVTQAQWQAIMGTTPWEGLDYVRAGPKNPATYVSWDKANEFCGRLSEKEGVTYRLPTEAEWEYACRAGTTTPYLFGDDWSSQLRDFAWFDKNASEAGEGFAHEVGLLKPNAFGLYDMPGNVGEWTQDMYVTKLPGGTDPCVVPDGTIAARAVRGANGFSAPQYCRSAARWNNEHEYRNGHTGFRIVRVLSSETTAGPVRSSAIWPAAFRRHFGTRPTGRFLWTFDRQTGAVFWDSSRGLLQGSTFPPRPGSQLLCLDVSPDERWVATAFRSAQSRTTTLILWDLTTGKVKHTVEGLTADVNQLAWHPSGKLFATGASNRQVSFWGLEADKPFSWSPGVEHLAGISGLTFHPTVSSLVASSFDGNYKIWYLPENIDALQPPIGAPHTFGNYPYGALGTGYDVTSKNLIMQSATTVDVWEFTNTAHIRLSVPGTTFAWAPDGKSFVTAGGAGMEMEAKRWDTESGKMVAHYRGGCTQAITTATFSPSGKVLFTDGSEAPFIVWDVESGEQISEQGTALMAKWGPVAGEPGGSPQSGAPPEFVPADKAAPDIPSGGQRPARVAVAQCHPLPMAETGLWIDIPESLHEATVYEPPHAGKATFRNVVEVEVLEGGILALAAAWGTEPIDPASSINDPDMVTEQQLIERGWKSTDPITRSNLGGVLDKQRLFQRNVKTGEKFRLAARNLTPPFVIVPDSRGARP